MNIERLQKIGLSPYEAKCYLTLLKYGKLLGKDIAKKSGIPPTSIYRNLESLQKKGFVQVIQKEPFIYQGINPEIAVSTFIEAQREELVKLEETTIRDLKSIKEQKIEKREEVLEIYAGREQAYRIGKDLIKKSKKEFLLLGSGSQQSILDIIHDLIAATKRGVNCKFIVTMYGENKELIESLKKNRISLKYYPLENFSLLVKDKKESLVAFRSVKERIVLKVKDNDFSQAHAHYFQSIWKKATPL